MVKLQISMTEEMHSGLKNAAKQRGQTLTSLIRQVLWDWWEAQQNEQDMKEQRRRCKQYEEPCSNG